MKRLPIPALLWIGFAIVVVHNFEEWLMMGRFLDAHRSLLPSFLSGMTRERFTISLAIVTLIALVMTWAGARSRPNSLALVAVVAMQTVMTINAVQHAAMTVWARGYVPGTASAMLIVVPFAFYLVRRALRERSVAVKPFVLASAVEAVLLVPLLLGVHAVSMLW